MIDGQQLHAIEIDRFFQGFHEAEAQLAILLAKKFAVHLDVFLRTGNIALTRRNPVSDYACAEHVADQLIVRAVPGEQRGTRTSAPVNLGKALFPVAGDLNFVLKHACGPKHANNIGLFGLPEANNQLG